MNVSEQVKSTVQHVSCCDGFQKLFGLCWYFAKERGIFGSLKIIKNNG